VKTTSEKRACKLDLRYDSDGKLMDGHCDCGQKFYPFSRERKDAQKVLQYLQKQWHEHFEKRYAAGED
jgi:hypothetical protein